MNIRRSPLSHPSHALLVLTAALVCLPAGAAEQNLARDAKLRYQRESAACARIAEHDARANCLSEASTRYHSTLPTPPEEAPQVLRQNAFKRCEPLPDELRRDCVARMQGQGTVSGSVSGGGIYRELVTREVLAPAGGGPSEVTAPPPPPPPAPETAPPPPPAQ